MSVHVRLKESIPICYLGGLSVISLLLLLAGCNGSYNSTAPSANPARAGVGAVANGLPAAPVHLTDARLAFAFSDDIIHYSPPCPPGVASCSKDFLVGNPVNSFSIDPVSGMPALIGMPGDVIPGNTLSITTATSDNFLYMLTGDSLVYTFSIGYLIFSEAEFKNQNLDPLILFNALSRAGYLTGPALSSGQVVDKLIALLEDSALYDRIAAKNPHVTQTDEILSLKAKSVNIRGKLFGDLPYNEKKIIVNLNRLMIELVYPAETPKNKGISALHAVGSPVESPPLPSSGSIEVEPLGQFAYVLGASLGVYSIDQATGALFLKTTQPMALGQLIFSPSGLFAYGSTNGALHTYRIDRGSGTFTELGSPVAFTGWLEGADFNLPPSPAPWQKAPFRNMIADPTGNFLYLISSAGNRTSPDELGNCPGPIHQIGSLIHTFIVDKNTGLLTPSGPPLSTAPHIMRWGAVDPFGRFVQLLNTHEYSGSDYTPGGCSGDTTYPLKPGDIYSYYVEQTTGHLYPSGSVAAGGREYPAGFVNAGMDSISITGDVTGRFLYLLNAGDMYVYGVDQADGALTAVGSPLTGATVTAMPGKTDPPHFWPSECYTDSVFNGYCTLTGSRTHSMTWAGY